MAVPSSAPVWARSGPTRANMDEVQDSPKGFSRVVFLDHSILGSYICGICDLVLREPVQVFCGHRFCEPCVTHLIRMANEETCPTCLKEDPSDPQRITADTYSTDFACKRAMKNLEVQCEYYEAGCDFKGRFRMLERHLEECGFVPIRCQCGAVVPRKDQDQHKEMVCEYALDIPDEVSVEQHDKACVVLHVSKLRDLYAKFRATIRQTLYSLIEKISELEQKENEVTQGAAVYKKDAEPSAPGVMVDAAFLEETRKNMKVMEDKTKVTHNLFGVLFKEVQQAAGRVVTLERSMQQVIDSRDAQMEEMRAVAGSARASYNGVLIWTIDEMKRRSEEAQAAGQASILSPAFYTSRAGYKLCGRIYLHGDGIGRGQFLSLFLVMMKGKYDAMQKWPFQQFVTFTLMDQSGQGQHVRDSFRTDPGSTSFRRPRTEMNIASGCPRFMSLSNLHGKWSHYVNEEDQMLIEIKVDTQGMENFGGQGM